jgi:hypothetical protein
MAKRFTATEKWIDPWFCGLTALDKLFWVYLLDNCDHAGIWQVNWPLVGFHIKDYVFNKEVFKGRIFELKEQKWFIPKFIVFQYGELNPENRAHLSVIHILKKEGAYKGLNSSLDRGKDKDMDKDKVKDICPAQETYSYYSKTIKPGAKEDAIKNISKLLKTGVSKDDLLGRIDAYKAQLLKDKTDTKFYIQANNFFGEKARWKDFEPKRKIEYNPADPNCKICKGTGHVYIQNTGETKICHCRIKEGK